MDMLRAQQTELAGAYGDIFWSLPPSMSYVPGSEIHCRIYVANPTDEERQYMLAAALSRDGQVIDEFTVKVDDLAWFSLDAASVISLPGALRLDYSDCAMTVSLYEKETGQVTDSVSTTLTSQGTANLPLLPALPGVSGEATDIWDGLMMIMLIFMMISSTTRAINGK